MESGVMESSCGGDKLEVPNVKSKTFVTGIEVAQGSGGQRANRICD